jgi:hypothetical protein
VRAENNTRRAELLEIALCVCCARSPFAFCPTDALAESENAARDSTSQYIDGVALIGDGQKMELHTARTKLV